MTAITSQNCNRMWASAQRWDIRRKVHRRIAIYLHVMLPQNVFAPYYDANAADDMTGCMIALYL